MHDLAGSKLRLVRDVPVIGDWLFLLVYPIELRRGLRREQGLSSSVEGINTLQHAETDRRGYFPAVLASLRGVLRSPLEEEHRAITAAGVPVLAIWGDADEVIPLSSKDTLASWNPQAQQVVIEGAAHGLTYTHTDQVIEAFRTSRG